MRTAREMLDYKVVVRRVATGSAPFAWELHKGDTMIPVRVSQQRFKSMEAAYKAGQVELQSYEPPTRPTRSTGMSRRRVTALPPSLNFADDDDADDDELAEMDLAEQPGAGLGGSIPSS